ncbi:MAG: hypothetical protein DHS20C16_18630 [Phycisphaerae bacterium]|nr:MAG: hypothetical protein DHS20C16_18630 [Phycisphaerae bacterium]
MLRSSIDTAQFDGRYRLVPEESFQTYRNQLADAEANLAKQIAEGKPHDRQLALSIQDLKDLIQSASEQHSGFIIHDGVIHSGTLLVQEFSLRRAEIVGDTLTGSARWHEDVLDPGDVHDIEVRLILKGDRLEFSLGAKGEGFGEAVVLERVASGD